MAITIDDTARFVSVLSFDLASNDAPAMAREIERVVEQRAPHQKGFIGSIVMRNEDKTKLLVVSIWESNHAWSAAQYDREIGRVVSEVVETAKSYDIQTYETMKIVRGNAAT